MVADEPRVARRGQEARNRWADMLNPVGVSETGCLILDTLPKPARIVVSMLEAGLASQARRDLVPYEKR